MKSSSIGRFISLEGIEGVGKTTQREVLAEWLRKQDIFVVETREPGGTAYAEQIRELLLIEGAESPTAITELLLMFAARAQHVQELIRPALAAGQWVLCDRFTDATLAYQGAGRGLDRDAILALAELCHGGTWPDLTLLFDMAPEESLERRVERGTKDRIEAEALTFFDKVRAGYLDLAAREPQRIKVIDARASASKISQRCFHELEQLLKRSVST